MGMISKRIYFGEVILNCRYILIKHKHYYIKLKVKLAMKWNVCIKTFARTQKKCLWASKFGICIKCVFLAPKML